MPSRLSGSLEYCSDSTLLGVSVHTKTPNTAFSGPRYITLRESHVIRMRLMCQLFLLM